MSQFYRNQIKENAFLYGENGDNTFQLFNRRKLFEETNLDTFSPEKNPHEAVNFWEKPYYGLTDTKHEPVQVKNDSLKQVPSEGDKIKVLVNFVADAFRDLHEHFKKARGNQRIATEDTDLVFMKANRAWKDPNDQYYLFVDNLMKQFVEVEIGEFKSFEDVQGFNDFEDSLVEYLHKLNRSPFLRSAYFKSKKSSPFFSGLVVEVIPKKYGSHVEAAQIYGDPNYEFYAKSARKFGFAIDKNAPWRLYADLDSPAMKEYMERYGLNTPQDVFDELYHNLFSLELDNIRDLLVEYYNNYAVSAREKEKKQLKRCADGKYRAFPVDLGIVTRDSYNQISNEEMIETFFNIASVYGSYERSIGRQEKILRGAKERLKHFGPQEAVRFAYGKLIGL